MTVCKARPETKEMQLMSNTTVAKIDNQYATATEFRWMIYSFGKGQFDLLSSLGCVD